MSPLGSLVLPVCLAATGVGLGLSGLVATLLDRGATTGTSDGRTAVRLGGVPRRVMDFAGLDMRSLAAAAGAGIVCVLVTGWPVAGPIAVIAVYGLPRLLRQTTAASSIANLEALRSGDEDMAIVQSDWQYYAVKGLGPFKSAGPFDGLRALFAIHGEPLTMTNGIALSVNRTRMGQSAAAVIRAI